MATTTKENIVPDLEVNEAVLSLEECITSLEQHLAPFFETPLDDITAKLTPLEVAKLNILLAYSLNTLFYGKILNYCKGLLNFLTVYMRVKGFDPTEHPVKSELVSLFNTQF
jgi:exosome complex protein LRP1